MNPIPTIPTRSMSDVPGSDSGLVKRSRGFVGDCRPLRPGEAVNSQELHISVAAPDEVSMAQLPRQTRG